MNDEPEEIRHLREQFKAIRATIKSVTPEGQRRTFALVDLERAEMMAVKAFYHGNEE